MTLVIDLPSGRVRHVLPADLDGALRVVHRLAPHIPTDGVWHVEDADLRSGTSSVAGTHEVTPAQLATAGGPANTCRGGAGNG